MARRLLAELLGTFILVFAGTAAIVVNDTTGKVTHVGVCLTWGLAVLAVVYALGEASGAHLNPAVTISFLASKRFPLKDVPGYVTAQCAGALLASLFLRFLFPSHPTLGATLPAGDVMQSFWLEIAQGAILMLVILGASTGSKEAGAMTGAAIGGTVALLALFAGPISGASMNPARSLAPALVSGHTEHLGLYLAAPVLGMLGGAGLWALTRRKP